MQDLQIQLARVEKSLYVMESAANQATAVIRAKGEENMSRKFMEEYQEYLAGWDRMKAKRDHILAQIKAAS